jgi:hypothetical protein
MVKSLIEFIKEESLELTESGLSRILHHNQSTEFGTISAARPNKTPEQNKADNKELETGLRSHGYGIKHLNGTWKNDDGSISGEHSLMVMARKQHQPGELLNHLKEYGKKYDQDAILHKSPTDEHAHVHGTSAREGAWPGDGKSADIGKIHFNNPKAFVKSSPTNKSGHFAYQTDDEL